MTPSLDLRLRPVADDDRDFLLRLYASTRADELTRVPWSEEQKRAFVEMQFRAQSAAYAEYTGTRFDIVMFNGVSAGRLYVARRPDEIGIVDISLLPEFRGQQIGTTLLRELMAEAARARRPLRIHVERFNPALRLYERLGFRPLADLGIYLQLEWRSD